MFNLIATTVLPEPYTVDIGSYSPSNSDTLSAKLHMVNTTLKSDMYNYLMTFFDTAVLLASRIMIGYVLVVTVFFIIEKTSDFTNGIFTKALTFGKVNIERTSVSKFAMSVGVAMLLLTMLATGVIKIVTSKLMMYFSSVVIN